MAKAASSPELRRGLEKHLRQTEAQVARLEQIFQKLDFSPGGESSKAMDGLIENVRELLSENAEPEVLDAGLIAAAQKVEHHEIAGYGTVRTYAQLLGEEEAAKLLQQTLDEEAETDQKLTRLAENSINLEALA